MIRTVKFELDCTYFFFPHAFEVYLINLRTSIEKASPTGLAIIVLILFYSFGHIVRKEFSQKQAFV